MKHSAKEWLAATRYWALPVSTMPVVAAFCFLFSKGLVSGGWMPWLILLLCLLGVVLLHSAGNVLSDWADYKYGVDNPDAFAVPNLVFHKFEPREYLWLSIVLFVLGILVGLVLTFLCGLPLLIAGGIGVLLTLLYSFLKFHALGDLDIFIIFGLLTVLGTTFCITGQYVWDALVVAIPIGIITVSVLHANNTRDMESDRAAGIKTFAMLLGGKASARLYCTYMALPFICILFSVIFGELHPLALLCLVAVVPAWKNTRQARRYKEEGIQALQALDFASSRLQLVFSGSLSIGLFIAGLI